MQIHFIDNILKQASALFCTQLDGFEYCYITSSSCHAISMDISDPLLPLLPIVYCFWQVLRATSCIGTELLYVGLSWLFCLCTSM